MSIKEEYAVIPDMEDAPPRLFVHIVNVYNAMLEGAQERQDGSVVWEGLLTYFLEQECEVNQSMYSRVVGLLSQMGCVLRLRRGSGSVKSQWAMIGPPTFENYEYIREREGFKQEKRVDPKEAEIKGLRSEVTFLMEINRRLLSYFRVSQTDMFNKVFGDLEEDGVLEVYI